MIYKYLLEIKYRCFFSVIAWSFIMINCYYFKETLLYVFMRFSSKPNDAELLFFLTTDVAEVFIAYVNLSFSIANQIIILFIYCQIFFFLSTGLYIFEHTYFKTFLILLIICWMIFLFLLNNYIFPTSWDFFFKFQKYLSFQNITVYFEVKLNEYLVFYKSIYYLCNILCQTVILFCVILDLFKTNLLIVKKLRKLFYFIFFIFSTFLTPPEIIYQLTVGISIIVIYELIIIHLIIKTEIINFDSYVGNQLKLIKIPTENNK
jgi:sec-independent protein translocase protein TatC